MPSVCNCWCILLPVCRRRGILRGSFCSFALRAVVVNHVWFIKKLVLLSARFHLHKPLRRTNRLWPAAIPPWNFFLHQTALLSTLPFSLGPPPDLASIYLPPLLPLPLLRADDVVFFALVFDCPPWEVPGSGCMWQASAWTRLSPPLFCLLGHAAWERQYPWLWRGCAWGWPYKRCRQEDLGHKLHDFKVCQIEKNDLKTSKLQLLV